MGVRSIGREGDRRAVRHWLLLSQPKGGIVRGRLEKDRVFKRKYEGLKSIIRV
jgi:hypothetical protein